MARPSRHPQDPFRAPSPANNFAGVHPRLERIAQVNTGTRGLREDEVTSRARRPRPLFGQPVRRTSSSTALRPTCSPCRPSPSPRGGGLLGGLPRLERREHRPRALLGCGWFPCAATRARSVLPRSTRRWAAARGARRPAGRRHPDAAHRAGTVYAVEELKALWRSPTGTARGSRGRSRLGCAAAHGVGLRPMLVETGVDALSFGGTKQGMLAGEAVVFLAPDVGLDFPYWQSWACSASKIGSSPPSSRPCWRAISGSTTAAANAMARSCCAPSTDPQVEVAFPRPATPCSRASLRAAAPLQQETSSGLGTSGGPVRWMCAFDTEPLDIARFAVSLRRVLAGSRTAPADHQPGTHPR